MRFHLIIISIGFLLILKIQKVVCDDLMTKTFYDGVAEPLQEERRKKPFCNAFTGCGRKRADDSLGSLFEFNVEPAMDNFNRQIPINLRLPVWIALQNARSSKKSNDWVPARQFEHPFFNFRRKRCESENYLC